MAALRIEFVDLNAITFGGLQGEFEIFLDCWEWQLIVTTANSWFVNGMDLALLTPKPGDSAAFPVKFGGYIDEKGKPINFNSTLRFVNSGGAPFPILTGILVKVYYDRDLPQPD